MKQYKKPRLVEVELDQEQAVLGTCMAGATGLKHNGATWLGCRADCKRAADVRRGPDFAGNS